MCAPPTHDTWVSGKTIPGKRFQVERESVCCLLVLNLVSSTLFGNPIWFSVKFVGKKSDFVKRHKPNRISASFSLFYFYFFLTENQIGFPNPESFSRSRCHICQYCASSYQCVLTWSRCHVCGNELCYFELQLNSLSLNPKP
jgi:hypothetical protein